MMGESLWWKDGWEKIIDNAGAWCAESRTAEAWWLSSCSFVFAFDCCHFVMNSSSSLSILCLAFNLFDKKHKPNFFYFCILIMNMVYFGKNLVMTICVLQV
ncbi:hypothetical protein RYX36_033863 [Vicia faba]